MTDATGGYYVPNRWVPALVVVMYEDQRRLRGERKMTRTESNRLRRKIKKALYR